MLPVGPRDPLRITTDLNSPGQHFGDAMLRWSDSTNPLGYHPVPVISVRGNGEADGPMLLLVGGTHGDEFEGPSAIMRLVHGSTRTACAVRSLRCRRSTRPPSRRPRAPRRSTGRT